MPISLKTPFILGVLMSLISGGDAASAQESMFLVRLAEIEIDARYRDEYVVSLREEADASVKLEPGVIAILPMFPSGDSTRVRILEVYASREAYEAHLMTPHFTKYKSTTLKMIKSLNLIDMQPIDSQALAEIFRKVQVRPHDAQQIAGAQP